MSNRWTSEESQKIFEREAKRKPNKQLLDWVIMNSDYSWSSPTPDEVLQFDVHKAELYKRLKPWLEEK